MFDKLPIEAIRQIAEYVHLEHPPSLSSLALTNKLCHEVAKTWHWRIIHLNIVSREELRRDVSRWLAVLQQSRSLKHVRRLELRGDMPAKLEDEPSVDSPESPLSNDDWHGTDEIFGIEEDGGFARDASIEILPEEDEAWTPVVQLLQTIPHLADLVFSCHNQFPPSLFKALIDSQPHCRLHLPKFRFRSLRENITNEHEMRVATSPQLSSIGVCYVKRDSLANEDYNEEAVMQLIGGLAPNLRKVRMKRKFDESFRLLSLEYNSKL